MWCPINHALSDDRQLVRLILSVLTWLLPNPELQHSPLSRCFWRSYEYCTSKPAQDIQGDASHEDWIEENKSLLTIFVLGL